MNPQSRCLRAFVVTLVALEVSFWCEVLVSDFMALKLFICPKPLVTFVALYLGFTVFFIHMGVYEHLSFTVAFRIVRIIGIDIVAVAALLGGPVRRRGVELLVELHAVLPVGGEAALVAVVQRQPVLVHQLLVLPHVSEMFSFKTAKATAFSFR